MLASVGSVFGSLKKKVDTLGNSLTRLKKQNGDIAKLQAAQAKLAKLGTGGSAEQVAKLNEQIKRLSDSLRTAGVDTSRLTQEQARLAAQIASTERRLGRASGLNTSLNAARAQVGKVGEAIGKVRSNVGSLMTKIGLVGGAAGYAFKTQFLDVAAEFERLQTVLKTLNRGDVEKAKQNFGWISDFAAKTPYEIGQVTEAFVKMKQYGIDPIAGDSLRIIGDAAAGGGKDFMMGVEALADAKVGQYMRLKDFSGIDVDIKGDKATLQYTDELGKDRNKIFDKNNREAIRLFILGLWNKKYKGAMDEQSRTWKGMMSNVGDQWTRFTTRVMASGVFDWMKGKLGALLKDLDKAASDGRLTAWATQTGSIIKTVLEDSWQLAKTVKAGTQEVVAFVGGWKNLGMILGAVVLAPTVLSVGNLVVQLVKLVPALGSVGIAVAGMIGPWGLLAAAIGTAGVAVHQNWGGVGDWFQRNVTSKLDAQFDFLEDRMNSFKETMSDIGDWYSENFGPKFTKVPGFAGGPSEPGATAEPRHVPEQWKAPSVLMPPSAMQPRGGEVKKNFTQDIKLFITTPPGANPQQYGSEIMKKLKSPDLYDAAAEFMK